MNQENDKYTKLKKVYGYLASAIIVITIIHLLGFILLQSLITLNDTKEAFNGAFGMMLSYSTTQFVITIASKDFNLGLIKASGAIFSIVLGLVTIFLSSQAVKGKFIYHYLACGLYFLDTLFLIPVIVLSILKTFPLYLDAIGIVVSIVIHLIACAILIYSIVVARKIEVEEKNKPLYDSKENKSL